MCSPSGIMQELHLLLSGQNQKDATNSETGLRLVRYQIVIVRYTQQPQVALSRPGVPLDTAHAGWTVSTQHQTASRP
jgi:hypothetical protein